MENVFSYWVNVKRTFDPWFSTFKIFIPDTISKNEINNSNPKLKDNLEYYPINSKKINSNP